MKLGGQLRIVLSTLAWVAIVAYLMFAVRMCRSEENSLLLSTTEIRITDRNEIPIIDEETVRGWLREYPSLKDSIPLHDTDTELLKQFIETKPFVKRANVYTDMDGKLTIELSQRRPVARFSLRSGYDFYVSEDSHIMPAGPGGSIDVPLITGSFALPFERGHAGKIVTETEENGNFSNESYIYFTKLINFVRLVGSSTFWDAQIVQINVEGAAATSSSSGWKEPEIELIPRVGRHIILFGDLDDTQEKLDKLMLFYNKVLDYEGWEAYRTINLKYKDQIVCTRR